MNNVWKKILSVILTLVMVIGMMPSNRAVAITNLADADYTGDAVTLPEGVGLSKNGFNAPNLTEVEAKKNVAMIGQTGYATLAEAIKAANAIEGGATVTLLQNVTLGEMLTISGNVTISGAYTITRADTYTGTLFTVNSGATLTLDGGLTIDGGNEWTFDKEGYEAALWANDTNYSGFAFVTSEPGAPIAKAKMFIVNGSVIMNSVTIQNHMGNNGCGLVGLSGSLTLNEGATLKHNATSHSSVIASVSDGATLTINDGALITDNYYAKNGGIFQSSGTIIMNGGEISHNRGVNTNGTVVMMYQGNPKFILNDGLICDNSSVRGSGAGRCAPIYLHANTDRFEMNGGSICHNVSPGYAGVDGYHGGTKIVITGGYIGENISVGGSKYYDVYVNEGYCAATITGGTFTQDVSKWVAEGYQVELLANGTYGVKEDLAYGKVAMVGDAYFETLKEAIDAANAIEGGATVTLLQNVTLGEKLTITGNVTISGAYTITRADTYTGTLFAVSAGATLTLDGGLVIDGNNKWTLNEELYNKALNLEVSGVTWADLITSEEGKPNATAPMFKVTGSVVVKDVTIQNNYSNKSSNNGDYGVFQVDANATLTMTGATIKHIVTGGANSVAHLSTNSVWTINDGTLITDTFAGKNGGICRNDSGKLVMNGGEISNNKALDTNGTVVMLYKGTMEMNGGKICSNTGISGTSNGRCAPIYGHSTSTFIMTNGEICHNTGISYGGIDVPSSIKVEISGGYIGDNVSALGNANADVNGNENTVISGGTFTQDVSKWLAEGYKLVQKDDGTYGVKEDPTYGKVAEINGVYYETLSEAVADASADDTIKLMANVTLSESLLIDKTVTLDLNGYTIEFNEDSGAATISVAGTLTLMDSSEAKSGKIVRESNTECSAIAVAGGNLIMNGGTIISSHKGIQVGGTGKVNSVTITGGVIDATSAALNLNKGSVTVSITGGKLSGGNAVHASSLIIITAFTISGGEFEGNLLDIPEGKLSITGGTFSADVSEYCAEGYLCESKDGKFIVREANYVAQVGDVKYESLTEAIAAAQSGDTITFLADINETVTINKKLTIDGAGKTYTGKMNVTADITIKNVNFDGKGMGDYAVETRGAYYVVIEDCTAKNYGYGFLQVASNNVSTTVKNVTISDVGYGIKIDHSNGVTLENVNITASVAGLLNSNYGDKTITIKDSSINIIGTWVRPANENTTIVFEGANTVGKFILDTDNSPSTDTLKLAAGATLTAPEGLTILTDVADYKVVYENGVYKLGEKAIKVTVTVNDATMVEGNKYPEFSYTTDVEGVPTLTISYSVDGTTINATVAEMEGYEFTVVPGTLTVEKALVRAYAANNDKVMYFTDLGEALKYAAAQNDYVPVYVLDDLTVTETIVFSDDRVNTVELQGINNKVTITCTTSDPFLKVESGRLSIKNLTIITKGDSFHVTGGSLNLQAMDTTSQFLTVTSQEGNCVQISGGSVGILGAATLKTESDVPAVEGSENGTGKVTVSQWGNYPSAPTIISPEGVPAIDGVDSENVTIDRGYFSSDMADLCPEGYASVKQSDGTYRVMPMITVTVDDITMVAGNELPELTYTVNTFGKDVDLSGLTIVAGSDGKTAGHFTIVATLEVEGYHVVIENGVLEVTDCNVTVDGIGYNVWSEAMAAIKGDSHIVLYADVVNEGSFSKGAMWKTLTLDLNGHTFTTTTIGQGNHATLKIVDNSEAGGGKVNVTNFVALYVNGYLDVSSKVNFNAYIQISRHSNDSQPSTGCLLIDGVKWIGRGHFEQDDGIIGTTGGYVTISDNFQKITFNSGNFYLTKDADFTTFKLDQKPSITVNAKATLDLNGCILTANSFVCFSDLTDTAEKTGGVKVLGTNDKGDPAIILLPENSYMPIYDSANGCFRFYAYEMVSKGVQQQNTIAKFGIAIRFEKVEAYKLLCETENSYLTLTFTLTWENMGEVDPIVYEFTNEGIRSWAAGAFDYYSNQENQKDWALTLTVVGLEYLPEGDALTVAPAITSITSFTATSDKIEAEPVAIEEPGDSTGSTESTENGESGENGENAETGEPTE